MKEKIEQLKSLLGEIVDLEHTAAVLDWDQQTNMPVNGAEDRSYLQTTIARIHHVKATSDELGRAIEDLEPMVEQLSDDSEEKCLVKLARYHYDKKCKVSLDWAGEFARVTSIANSAWEKARDESDFSMFQPHLEEVVRLKQAYAEFFKPYQHIYDPLLDDFERGLKTSDVLSIFNVLRTEQVLLVKEISQSKQVDDAFLKQSFEEDLQWKFGVDVINRFGFDWNRGRQDRSAHPFTTTFGLDDVRITTRFSQDHLNPALFGTMHECGHALYEMGFARNMRRTPFATGASMALHESQSRLWENLVGRSYSFWQFFYSELQEVFSSQLGGISLSDFYKGINRVEPSLIRVEADEATYNMHIMLRLELEVQMVEGALAVKDLPEAWNTAMQEYLGIKPPNDALGVLQDVHWSAGLMGYFPTYALGNVISVQFWDCIRQEIEDLDEQISKGEFSELLNWLQKNIHVYGSKYEPQELVSKVTGQKISPEPYLKYLRKKYSEIYQL